MAVLGFDCLWTHCGQEQQRGQCVCVCVSVWLCLALLGWSKKEMEWQGFMEREREKQCKTKTTGWHHVGRFKNIWNERKRGILKIEHRETHSQRSVFSSQVHMFSMYSLYQSAYVCWGTSHINCTLNSNMVTDIHGWVATAARHITCAASRVKHHMHTMRV